MKRSFLLFFASILASLGLYAQPDLDRFSVFNLEELRESYCYERIWLDTPLDTYWRNPLLCLSDIWSGETDGFGREAIGVHIACVTFPNSGDRLTADLRYGHMVEHSTPGLITYANSFSTYGGRFREENRRYSLEVSSPHLLLKRRRNKVSLAVDLENHTAHLTVKKYRGEKLDAELTCLDLPGH